MKLALLLSALSFTSFAFADLDREYEKTRMQLIEKFEEAQGAVWAIEQEMADIRERCAKQAEFFHQGEKELARYDKLLQARYLDESGRYEPRLPLSSDDITHLNALVDKYLHWRPIPEKVSVRRARKLLADALDRLDDVRSENRFPHESTISELEIAGYQLEKASNRRKQIQKIASRLGVKLDREIASREDTSARGFKSSADGVDLRPTRPGLWFP